jgi:site-specific DNA recombinase
MQTNENKKVFHRKQTAMLKKEHTEIEDKLDRLLDLMMDGSITKEEFEAKKRKLKDRQYDIGELIKSLDEADDTFTKRLICLINLANGALEKFKGSNVGEKREMMNFVYSNLSLRGKNLEYSMRSPFKEFAECSIKNGRGDRT